MEEPHIITSRKRRPRMKRQAQERECLVYLSVSVPAASKGSSCTTSRLQSRYLRTPVDKITTKSHPNDSGIMHSVLEPLHFISKGVLFPLLLTQTIHAEHLSTCCDSRIPTVRRQHGLCRTASLLQKQHDVRTLESGSATEAMYLYDQTTLRGAAIG
eukprot:1047460-Amphidinium_carterae.1